MPEDALGDWVDVPKIRYAIAIGFTCKMWPSECHSRVFTQQQC